MGESYSAEYSSTEASVAVEGKAYFGDVSTCSGDGYSDAADECGE